MKRDVSDKKHNKIPYLTGSNHFFIIGSIAIVALLAFALFVSDGNNRDAFRLNNSDYMLIKSAEVSPSDVILDVSVEPKSYIDNAINIHYMEFNDQTKSLRPVSEFAKILGNAGISQNDSLVIYGECKPCGGGPSMATYVYWVMRYLGHDKVKLLDGGIYAWDAAGLPVKNESFSRPSTTYTPRPRTELLASYDYVLSGNAQIIDARSNKEFIQNSIPGSINIPSSDVWDDVRIKDVAMLEETFKGLSKNKPLIVYTNTGVVGSAVWFALNLTGHDARLYSWKDWLDHNPRAS
jgi:thiosulfate/3-mercaptopyruvate sulfurtransferase